MGLCLIGTSQTMESTNPQILYANAAVKILEDGSVISGKEAITTFYQKNLLRMELPETLFSVAANAQFQHEIGAFASKGEHYKQLIITDRENKEARVFEFTARAYTPKDYKVAIDRRRAEWITLCNKHNASDLVNGLYAENTIYYNHKPVVKTRDALIQEYEYMNNPKYSLQLTPLHVEPVNDNLAFEIGQCSGSYNGKYILIWEKDSTGKWYIKIDSNI